MGCPDQYQGKTVTRKARQSFVLTVPTSVTTPTWDCIIFFSGNLYPSSFKDFSGNVCDTSFCSLGTDGIVQYPAAPIYYPINTITSYAVPAGSPLFPDSATWSETHTDRFSSTNFEEFVFDDRVRLLGGGIEVEDDTPPLYRGGNIRVLDVPCSWDPSTRFTVRGDLSGLFEPVQSALMNAPPINSAQATQYASVCWPTEHGCYAVLKQSKMDNPFKPPMSGQPLYFPAFDMVSDCTANGSVQYGVGNPGTWQSFFSASRALVRGAPVLPTPFDMKCIVLTGLQPQARLLVSVNMLFETLPTAEDLKELALASPSPQWDMKAIELYSHVINDLPAAVPFADNADGSWFSRVAEALRDYAPTIGTALGTVIPGAGAIGSVLGKAGGLAASHAGDIEKAFGAMKLKAAANREKQAANKAKQQAQNPPKPRPNPPNVGKKGKPPKG